MAGALSAHCIPGYGGLFTGTGAPFRYSLRISRPVLSLGVWHCTHIAASSTMYLPCRIKSLLKGGLGFSWALERETENRKTRRKKVFSWMVDSLSLRDLEGHTLGVTLAPLILNCRARATTGPRFTPEPIRPPRLN